jgi:hypothetical protein
MITSDLAAGYIFSHSKRFIMTKVFLDNLAQYSVFLQYSSICCNGDELVYHA